MHAFSATTAGARCSFSATWLVRAATYSLPSLVWTTQDQGYALALALFLGALDGWSRLRLARSARSFVAETDALVVSSGLTSNRIAWSDVLAIEVWHRPNRVDYAAVHYQAPAGKSVATCWEQDHREELLRFVRECAALVQATGPRRTILRAQLGDRAVYLTLLRHLSLDVAFALLVGVLCGVASHTVWLGTAAGLLSTLIAATPHVCGPELVRKDGAWWQRRRNGEPTRLAVVPRSLRLWAGCLSE